MQKVYLAHEIEEGEILDIIGIFDSYEKAYKRCVELYEERGFSYKNDFEMFQMDYRVEAYIVR